MRGEVPRELRQFIVERAAGRCEYFRIPQAAGAYQHEPDHIVPVQHDGKTELENLALSCVRCNRHKGPNVGSFDPDSGELVPFYSPRKDKWENHFRLGGAIIQPLTPRGRVTVKILCLNDKSRVEERERLDAAGLYP